MRLTGKVLSIGAGVKRGHGGDNTILFVPKRVVELRGLEPRTPCLQNLRPDVSRGKLA